MKDRIEQAKGKVILDFYAEWCTPCKMLAPTLDKIQAENSDVEVIKVDIENHAELTKEYGVASIPTLVFLEDGKVVNMHVGLLPESEILNKFTKNN